MGALRQLPITLAILLWTGPAETQLVQAPFLATDFLAGVRGVWLIETPPSEEFPEGARSAVGGWYASATVRFRPNWGFTGEVNRTSDDDTRQWLHLGGVAATTPLTTHGASAVLRMHQAVT
jgi:hypothetical protein